MCKRNISLSVVLLLVGFLNANLSQATSKSLYVLRHQDGYYLYNLLAFEISGDELVFQHKITIPWNGNGPIDLAIDDEHNILFVSSESNDSEQGGNIIELFSAKTLDHRKKIEFSGGPGNITGLAYDSARSKLYATNRNTDDLYIFDWDPDALTFNLLLWAGF